MQRINYFTNPNFTGPFADMNIYGEAAASYNASTKQLNIHGGNGGYGFNLTVPKNAALVFACFLWTDHAKNPRPCAIYSLGRNGIAVAELARLDVTNDANNMLMRFTSPDTGRIRVEFTPNGSNVNIANPILELADTYDKAVGGGASELLHWGHDAKGLRRFVGRVMSDDGHERLSDTAYDGYAQTRKQRYGFMQYADSGKKLLCEFLGHGFRRLRENILWQRCCVHAGRAVYRPVLSIDKHDENINVSRVWLSNSPSDRLRRLRGLRFHETSVVHTGNHTLQRGYDAARLTLMGVMA